MLFLVLRNLSILSSTVVASFTFPPTVSEGFPFPHTLANILFLCLFDDSHSDRFAVISQVMLIYIYPLISDGKHCFIFLLAIHLSFSEKCLFRPSAPFFNGIFLFCFCFFFCCWVVWVLYIFLSALTCYHLLPSAVSGLHLPFLFSFFKM